MASSFSSMGEDIIAVLQRDPAATPRFEVVLCYSGLHALWCYRFHHWLWNHHARLFAQAASQLGRGC